MSRLLVAMLTLGATLPNVAFAQGAQPSAAQCETLVKYRDTGLYAEWSTVVGKSSAYVQAKVALDEAYADVNSTKSAQHVADAAGALAHVAGTLSTLTLNITGVRYRALERTVVSTLTESRSAIDWYFASDADRVVMIGTYMADMAASANAVSRAAVTVKDLALDLKGMTDDLAESASIRRQLDQQMSNLSRDAAQLQGKIDAVDASLARLGGVKDAIDKACGRRGCPVPGSETVSRKGSIVCLVSAQAACPGCRDGWRHRCDATSAGLAWKPLDECLPNDLKNAKAGSSRQKTAADLFAAQSTALSSTATKEERAERARESQRAASMFSDSVNRGLERAREQNAALEEARLNAELEQARQSAAFEEARQREASKANQTTRCPPIGRCAPTSQVACEC